MTSVTIQKLLSNDLQLVKELIRCWHEEEQLQPPLPGDEYLTRLLTDGSFHLLVAIAEGIVVGGLSAYELPMLYESKTEMFLYEIGVSTKARKQGIATALINELKTICAARHIETIFAGTEADNTTAKKLYLSTGADEEQVAWFVYALSNK